MIAVTALLRAKRGAEDELARVLRELTRRVRESEPRCLLYQAAQSQHERQLYLVFERYADEEALAAHANSAHVRDATPALMACLEDRPQIALFEELESVE
ncbi:MAG TPA: putative quinol monooxygenase [Myxococcota bacterium]